MEIFFFINSGSNFVGGEGPGQFGKSAHFDFFSFGSLPLVSQSVSHPCPTNIQNINTTTPLEIDSSHFETMFISHHMSYVNCWMLCITQKMGGGDFFFFIFFRFMKEKTGDFFIIGDFICTCREIRSLPYAVFH